MNSTPPALSYYQRNTAWGAINDRVEGRTAPHLPGTGIADNRPSVREARAAFNSYPAKRSILARIFGR